MLTVNIRLWLHIMAFCNNGPSTKRQFCVSNQSNTILTHNIDPIIEAEMRKQYIDIFPSQVISILPRR